VIAVAIHEDAGEAPEIRGLAPAKSQMEYLCSLRHRSLHRRGRGGRSAHGESEIPGVLQEEGRAELPEFAVAAQQDSLSHRPTISQSCPSTRTVMSRCRPSITARIFASPRLASPGRVIWVVMPSSSNSSMGVRPRKLAPAERITGNTALANDTRCATGGTGHRAAISARSAAPRVRPCRRAR